MWEGVIDLEHTDVEMKIASASQPEPSDKMDIDEKGDDEVKKRAAELKEDDGIVNFLLLFSSLILSADFYRTFWSLQLSFSRPPLFANPDMLNKFKEAVDKVLPVIKEATTKDRAMMGNRTATTQTTTLKRKRELEPGDETNSSDYFFAKFLTSPDLLSLEVPRRQRLHLVVSLIL